MDFEHNYQNRRAVFRAVQASQKAESKVVDEIRRKAIAGKQELLLLLSAWLLELKPETTIPAQDYQELQPLTDVAFADWIELQSISQEIAADLVLAEKQHEASQAKLKKYNPLSILAARSAKNKPEEQPDILLKNVGATHAKCVELKQKIKRNTSDRQILAEKILRDFLLNLDKISQSQAVGAEITEVTNRVTIDINTVWSEYQQQELQGLEEVFGAVNDLRHNFSASSQYLPVSEASTSAEGDV